MRCNVVVLEVGVVDACGVSRVRESVVGAVAVASSCEPGIRVGREVWGVGKKTITKSGGEKIGKKVGNVLVE